MIAPSLMRKMAGWGTERLMGSVDKLIDTDDVLNHALAAGICRTIIDYGKRFEGVLLNSIYLSLGNYLQRDLPEGYSSVVYDYHSDHPLTDEDILITLGDTFYPFHSDRYETEIYFQGDIYPEDMVEDILKVESYHEVFLEHIILARNVLLSLIDYSFDIKRVFLNPESMLMTIVTEKESPFRRVMLEVNLYKMKMRNAHLMYRSNQLPLDQLVFKYMLNTESVQ